MPESRPLSARLLGALLGISAYDVTPPTTAYTLDDANVTALREALGGNIQQLPTTKTRWMLADLESAQYLADQGDLSMVGQLHRAMRRDGYANGLMNTRTSGLVALPKVWRGDQRIVDALKSENGTRPLFDEMFPPAELALLARDGIGVGVGVAELLPVKGRDFPVMCRLDPEFLTYRWNEDRWYFRSTAGLLPITPGDGRWILHTPGGRLTPWNSGSWHTLGRAFITKEHAMLHRANYSRGLANPARVAHAPQGATEPQRLDFLRRLMQWGLNTVIALPPGYEAALLESNGRGWEVFTREIDTANFEFMIVLAGQVVTVTGGSGFANADIHATIRADLIKETGDTLAHTINTQGIPPFVIQRWGEGALANTGRVSWDTTPSADRAGEAQALNSLAMAIDAMSNTLARQPKPRALDIAELIAKFSIPVLPEGAPTVTPPAPEATAQLPTAPDTAPKGPPNG